jgi:uncharacterized protein YutE (UPF0331/DUF86 family)
METQAKTSGGSQMIQRKEQAEDITERLEFIKSELKDLPNFFNLSWNEYQSNGDARRSVERLAENVANAAIDISKIILAGEITEMPNSYKDIILKLGQIKIIDEAVAEKVAEYATLRNTLAHRYLDLKWDKIKTFISNATADFDTFIKQVSQKISV